tara:strand:+ start:62 stop:346 length:285 start_codon:yes stop_codon:yes gene_type:complete
MSSYEAIFGEYTEKPEQEPEHIVIDSEDDNDLHQIVKESQEEEEKDTKREQRPNSPIIEKKELYKPVKKMETIQEEHKPVPPTKFSLFNPQPLY